MGWKKRDMEGRTYGCETGDVEDGLEGWDAGGGFVEFT